MLTVPVPDIALDEATAHSAPARPGVYAAWITDSESLAQCGVAGPGPRVVYIGKASGRGGLRSRLLSHAQSPFFSLLDLLASRGTVLPCWWNYAEKDQPYKRTVKAPPLAKLAEDEALAWQREHFRWGWMAVDESRLVESTMIADHQPLLNLHGRGLTRLGPPQLRLVGQYERDRAAWMFSIAWIAVITIDADDWSVWHADSRSLQLEIDDEGWPTPLGQGGRLVKLELPTNDDAQAVIRRVRHVEFNGYDDEAFTWWSAYAGLTFRPGAQSVDDALPHVFARAHTALDTPSELPSPARLVELLELIRRLPRVVH